MIGYVNMYLTLQLENSYRMWKLAEHLPVFSILINGTFNGHSTIVLCNYSTNDFFS